MFQKPFDGVKNDEFLSRIKEEKEIVSQEGNETQFLNEIKIEYHDDLDDHIYTDNVSLIFISSS